MTPTETAAFLRRYNEWRRTDDRYGLPHPDPREIGEAIDAAVEMIDRLEAAESEAIEQASLNGMGAERELALMTKLEATEKTNREWLRANAPGDWIDNLRVDNDTLRAKIAEMEQQEPIGWLFDGDFYEVRQMSLYKDSEPLQGQTALYAIPGAQPAPSVPEFCPCCGNIMRACMSCPNEDCNAVTATAEQSKYNKQHALARKASGAAAPEAKS